MFVFADAYPAQTETYPRNGDYQQLQQQLLQQQLSYYPGGSNYPPNSRMPQMTGFEGDFDDDEYESYEEEDYPPQGSYSYSDGVRLSRSGGRNTIAGNPCGPDRCRLDMVNNICAEVGEIAPGNEVGWGNSCPYATCVSSTSGAYWDCTDTSTRLSSGFTGGSQNPPPLPDGRVQSQLAPPLPDGRMAQLPAEDWYNDFEDDEEDDEDVFTMLGSEFDDEDGPYGNPLGLEFDDEDGPYGNPLGSEFDDEDEAYDNTLISIEDSNSPTPVCTDDVHVCEGTDVVLSRDPDYQCRFRLSLCNGPLSSNPTQGQAARCQTEREKADECFHKAQAMGYDVDDATWPFFSDDIDTEAGKREYPHAASLDKALYIRGCYVYTTGSLKNKAFYGGDASQGTPTRVQLIDYPCSENTPTDETTPEVQTPPNDEATPEVQTPPSELPVWPTIHTADGSMPVKVLDGSSAGGQKIARAKAGAVPQLGEAAPLGAAPGTAAQIDETKLDDKLFWPIFGTALGISLLGFGACCLRKKKVGCCGKKGYGSPENAKRNEASMDSVECPDSKDKPEPPNYNEIVKEALADAVREEQQQIQDNREDNRESVLSEQGRVVLSVGTPASAMPRRSSRAFDKESSVPLVNPSVPMMPNSPAFTPRYVKRPSVRSRASVELPEAPLSPPTSPISP